MILKYKKKIIDLEEYIVWINLRSVLIKVDGRINWIL